MAKKEVKTDLWVAKQLDECNIRYDAQGSNTTDTGEPDYAYMEQYSKNMMLRKYKQYLEFINRQNVTEVD